MTIEDKISMFMNLIQSDFRSGFGETKSKQ